VDHLYGYVRGHVRSDDAAEDVVAQVFLNAWRSIRRYRTGSGMLRRWMVGIARNEVRDYWKQAAVPVAPLPAELPMEPPDVENPEEWHRLVTEALAVLTPEQRDVVVLRYFQNLPFAAIATILNKREGAVRATLFRALRRMKKVISDAPR
jgi:RNA polymerase sigma-70 factor (ECF subfamily)